MTDLTQNQGETQMDRILSLAALLDEGADLTNSTRGARVLRTLAQDYDHDPEDLQSMVRDALTDLHHACDMLGLAFHEERAIAQAAYASELLECGIAPDISEGWE